MLETLNITLSVKVTGDAYRKNKNTSNVANRQINISVELIFIEILNFE